MLYLLIFVIVVLLDQFTKALVDGAYAQGDGVTIIKGIFSITNSHNKGAAFSGGADIPWAQTFFIVITVVALVLALTYLIFGKSSSKWLNTTITLIAAGAIGNFIDRITFKEVRDFLDIEFFANCNVADVAITVGAIMLIVYLLFISDDALFKAKPKKNEDE